MIVKSKETREIGRNKLIETPFVNGDLRMKCAFYHIDNNGLKVDNGRVKLYFIIGRVCKYERPYY